MLMAATGVGVGIAALILYFQEKGSAKKILDEKGSTANALQNGEAAFERLGTHSMG